LVIIDQTFRDNDLPNDFLPDDKIPTPKVCNTINVVDGIYNLLNGNSIGNICTYLKADFANFGQMILQNFATLWILKPVYSANINRSLFQFNVNIIYDPVHQIFNKFMMEIDMTATAITKNDSTIVSTINYVNADVKGNSAFTTPAEVCKGPQLLGAFTTGIDDINHIPHEMQDGTIVTGNLLSIVPSSPMIDSSTDCYQTVKIDGNIPILGHIESHQQY
jgi:hypothetical protein